MLAMLAIAVALTSPEKYVATIPVCTNLIEGRVMGPDGDYNTMRAEDVAWLWEAVNERKDMEGGDIYPTSGIDSRTGRTLAGLGAAIATLTNCWNYFALDEPPAYTKPVDFLQEGQGVTNDAMAMLLQAGAKVGRWPYWPDAASVRFGGAPSLGTATNAFALFTRNGGDAPQRLAIWSGIFYAAVGNYTDATSNEWTTLSTEVRDGYVELTVEPHTNISSYAEYVTNTTGEALFDGSWGKDWGNHYNWTQKFINQDGMHEDDYAGHWASAVTRGDYLTVEKYEPLMLCVVPGGRTNMTSCIKTDGTMALLAFRVRASRSDAYHYSEGGYSTDAPSWNPAVDDSRVTLSSNVNAYVYCWTSATYVGAWLDDGTSWTGLAVFAVNNPDAVLASVIGAVTDIAFFRDCDTSYFSPVLTSPPGDFPPAYGKGASWTADETMNVRSWLDVRLEYSVIVPETDFPATVVKGEDPDEGEE